MTNATTPPILALSQAAHHRRRSFNILLDGARRPSSVGAQLLLIGLLVWMLAGNVPWMPMLLWAIPLAMLVIYQAVFSHLRLLGFGQTCSDSEVIRQLRHFTVLAGLIGCCWAVGGFLLFPAQHEELQLFLVFVLGGMSLAAVGLQHVHLPACYATMGSAVPVLSARYALEAQALTTILLIVFTLVIIRLALVLSRFSQRTADLQYQRDQLLAELTQGAQALEYARREAEEANLAKSRFLAQASHDLRQPLHAVSLLVETINQEQASKRIAGVIDRIQQSLSVLSKLFDSLLDVTLLDARQTAPNFRSFALQEIFEQLEHDFRPIAVESKVNLRFARSRVGVHTDPVLLRRLLQNLLSNAIRHAPGAKVLVGARRSLNGDVRIQVLDSGIGIAEQDQEKIFREFVRLDSVANDAEQAAPGLGLGLAIVQRLAKLLSLQVLVSSTPGRGSCFTVAGFAPARGPLATLNDEQEVDHSNMLSDTRVMVVDDDQQVLNATGTLLRKWGCHVILYETAPTSNEHADVLISDYELPEQENGLQLISRLKNNNPKLAALLISGNSTAELAEAAAVLEIPLLHKPVRPVQLRSALLHVLTRTRDE